MAIGVIGQEQLRFSTCPNFALGFGRSLAMAGERFLGNFSK